MAHVRTFQQLLSAKKWTRTAWIDISITSRPDLSPCTHGTCARVRGFANGRSLQARPSRSLPTPKKISKAKSNGRVEGTPSLNRSTSLQTNTPPPAPAESKTPSVPRRPTTNNGSPKASASVGSFRNSQVQLQARLENLFKSGDKVLLYRSRDSKAFTFWSFFVGAMMLSGAAATFRLVFVDSRPEGAKTSLLIVVPESAVIAVFLWMGCLITYAPIRTLKSVSALANRGGPLNQVRPTLVFEMSKPLPFMNNKTFEVAPQDVSFGRKLVSHETKWYSVPLSRAASFTEGYYNPTTRSRGVGQRIVDFNRSLVDIWPSTKTAIAQMAWRAGFARVQFKDHGSWKMNMQDAELLDGGQALRLLSMKREEEVEFRHYLQRMWGKLKAKLS